MSSSHFSAGWLWAQCNPLDANRFASEEAISRRGQVLDWFIDGIDAWRKIRRAHERDEARIRHRRELFIKASK